ncbi:hypothetical protein Hesp01_57080 [Herbidospora sp. NBRC 101105]|nr:hypothetical protein Hesp01_57080 [Herbidospora sp. NBRC 101105]
MESVWLWAMCWWPEWAAFCRPRGRLGLDIYKNNSAMRPGLDKWRRWDWTVCRSSSPTWVAYDKDLG